MENLVKSRGLCGTDFSTPRYFADAFQFALKLPRASWSLAAVSMSPFLRLCSGEAPYSRYKYYLNPLSKFPKASYVLKIHPIQTFPSPPHSFSMSSSYSKFRFHTSGLAIYFLCLWCALALPMDPRAQPGTALSTITLIARDDSNLPFGGSRLPVPVHGEPTLSSPKIGIPPGRTSVSDAIAHADESKA